jgi:hypothetical protein
VAEVEALVESLWELDDDQLAAQIGSRAQAIGDNVAFSGARGAFADPASLDSIEVDVATKAPIDPRLLDAGRRLFDRINPIAYELLCKPLGGEDPETQKILDEAISQNYTKAAGMLAPVLISGLGLAPTVATLLATLIIKKIANYAATGICETWQKNLPKPAS